MMELANYGVTPMSSTEMTDANGGLIWLVAVVLLAGCATTGTNQRIPEGSYPTPQPDTTSN